MSDNKRSKKYNSLKESKRTIILAKKEDRDDDQFKTDQITKADQPTILTKPKSDAQPIPITIAAREGTDNSSRLSSSPTHKNVSAVNKELIAPTFIEQPPQKLPKMLQPMDIITNHYHLNTQIFNYLNDSNANFFVVGIIGCQGTGKSTLLNLLGPMDKNVDVELHYFKDKNGIFKTYSNDQSFSASPTTEGIQMFITDNRMMLLDCSPILCNQYLKKDSVQSEIDDLKMIIFLMNVCHLLIVVQEETINLSLMRLLHCAEMMKPNLDKDSAEEHYPCVMFVKNMADSRDFSLDAKNEVDFMYKKFFQLSKLKIFRGNIANGQDIKSSTIPKSINYFVFPEINTKQKKIYFRGDMDINSTVEEFRRRIFMSPKKPLQIVPQQGIFTEKIWSTLVTNAWESHKSNYFLRKYENFKEKEWSTNRPT